MILKRVLAAFGFVKVSQEIVSEAKGTNEFLKFSKHYWHGTENYRNVASEHQQEQEKLIKILEGKS